MQPSYSQPDGRFSSWKHLLAGDVLLQILKSAPTYFLHHSDLLCEEIGKV
jgi:hypothetical protein